MACKEIVMATVKNISNGPRGVWLSGKLIMVEPGGTTEADDFAPEWFEETDDEGPEGDPLSALTLPALKALAAEEGTDLGAATKKADIIAAIEAARAAKAAGGDGNQ
jgi:hypothetical protein